MESEIFNLKINVKKKIELRADRTCMHLIKTTQCKSVLSMSNHALDERVGGGLGDLLPDLDQDISELLDSLWCCLVALDAPMHKHQCLRHLECAYTHWPHEAGHCHAGGTQGQRNV